MKLKKIWIIIAAVVVVIGLTIGGIVLFSGKDSPSEPEVTPTPSPSPEPEIVSNVKIIDLNSKTRPYAVMINCKTEALPQAGLADAYIVYEEMVEGGITRMMALFKDKELAKVGSARSARVQYLPYVFENDAIYVHAGGSPESLKRIRDEKIEDIDVDGQYGVRDRSLKRDWEHTLFTNSKLLDKAAKDKGLRTTTDNKSLLNYSEEELDLSKYKTGVAKKVSIKYSYYRTSIYEYDSDKLNYLRFMNKHKNTDLVTGEQYRVKNIIVYGVKYDSYTYRSSTTQYQRPAIIGHGEGYYITDGVSLPITWDKKDESSKTIYKIKETGEELIVNDGNTYIQIYPSNGGSLVME